MPDLTADRFREYFEALWQRAPFAWQSALAKRTLTRDGSSWPAIIALPTAAGKTACIDIAVYALAASLRQEGSVVGSTAARRIFFVVDRRIIVDEAHERSQDLARKLREAKHGILKEVADSLRQMAYGRNDGEYWRQEEPLLTFELRGGMYRSEAWARSPLQPIVVSSTVDQLGSRLLFRAYGRGPSMWPVLAGLVANDSLILMDEAHYAKPFLETLRAVATYQQLAPEPSAAPLRAVVLSATPPVGIDGDVFCDDSAERDDPAHPLGRRRLAHKPAALIDPVPAKGGRGLSDRFADALARKALELAQGELKAVVIFANRVVTARAVHQALQSNGHNAILLTGRMRSCDKDDVIEHLTPLSARHSETRSLQHSIFIVATQTLEVGADLDFDALVTECASLDALRQRFGRLNRMGRSIAARAAILIRQEQSQSSDDDWVYGSALAGTWNWLKEQAGTSGQIDFGVAHLEPRLPQGDALEALTAPSLNAPVLLPAHLDFLAQTAPVPKPSPEVSLFLHGPTGASADVQVCWRTDIRTDGEDWEQKGINLILQCPPASIECLPVPIWRFRQWMNGGEAADDSSDVEGIHPPENGDMGSSPRSIIRWSSRRDKGAEWTHDADSIRPGDVVVIPAGQYENWKPLGDLAEFGQGAAVLDWGDRAYCSARARPLLRLHPDTISQFPDELVGELLKEEVSHFASSATKDLEEDPDTVVAALKVLLAKLAKRLGDADVPRSWQWLAAVTRALAADRKLPRNILPHPFGGLILRGSRRLSTSTGQPDVFTDEDDSSASGTVPVPLAEHLPGVAKFSRRFADASGLPKALADAIELAGLFHDLGKADPRFQSLLRNGQRFVGGELLAKSASIPKNRTDYQRAREAAEYPEGGRHELLSVRLAESAESMLPKDSALRELVLHLIASHHGYCRPFAPVVLDERPASISFELLGHQWSHEGPTLLEQLDSGVSDRFWRLIRRHGWWGIAWLEALLRLADHRRSEYEQNQWEARNG